MESHHIEICIEEIISRTNPKRNRDFLRDIYGQIIENDEIFDILKKTKDESQFFAITIDRRKNDEQFSYAKFDLFLSLLDQVSGGNGKKCKINQVRVIKWRSDKDDLLKVVSFFALNNRSLLHRRALILPFPIPSTAHILRVKRRSKKRFYSPYQITDS